MKRTTSFSWKYYDKIILNLAGNGLLLTITIVANNSNCLFKFTEEKISTYGVCFSLLLYEILTQSFVFINNK